ncbi:MAG: adenosine kinase [Spirochaetota bacterium]
MQKYDVFGVGNALVDTLVLIEDDFLQKKEISKGAMTLVDTESQTSLLADLDGKKKELRSGGSAANTMIALANSGGTGCYIGKVANDENGAFYRKDMQNAGIAFEVEPGKGATGTCVVLTTPDAERTMLTNLGISIELTESDIDLDKLKNSKISYVEGYLWDGEGTKAASVKTMEESKKHGLKVAYTYSDPFCVGRSREDFIHLTKEYIDIAFCNFEEAKAMSGEEDAEKALSYLGGLCELVFMTMGAEGAMFSSKGQVEKVAGFPVKAIDTVGAGDAFAAGVLYGLTHGLDMQKSCRWGNYAASRIVMEIGARHSISLKEKLSEVLG